MYLMVKKTRFNDLLFELKLPTETILQFIRKKIALMEKRKDASSIKVTYKIGKVLAQKTDVERKYQSINTIILAYYFKQYKKRFCGFQQSDLGLKTLMIWSGVGGFVAFSALIYDYGFQNDLSNQEIYPLVLLSSLLLFIVPVCFSLIWTFGLYAWFGLLKWIYFMLGSRTGVFHVVQQHVEEHLIAFKPGGRNTHITFSGLNK
jgi:hypothetical protein